jgi:hypothetical protein
MIPKSTQEIEDMKHVRCQKFAMVVIRANLAYVIGLLINLFSNLIADYKGAERVMYFLQSAKDYHLKYKSRHDAKVLIGQDASSNENEGNNLLTKRYVFMLARRVVSWYTSSYIVVNV